MRVREIQQIEKVREGVDVAIGISEGVGGPAAAVATAMDRMKFMSRVNVNFMYPKTAKYRVEALSKVIEGVLTHFPDMPVLDVGMALQSALARVPKSSFEQKELENRIMNNVRKDLASNRFAAHVIANYEQAKQLRQLEETQRLAAKVQHVEEKKKSDKLTLKSKCVARLKKLGVDGVDNMDEDVIIETAKYVDELQGDVDLNKAYDDEGNLKYVING